MKCLQKNERERRALSLKACFLIALAVPSNLCDFNPLEITTPYKFQQQGIYFPTLNHLYVIMFYLFYIIILGTWEGGNSKNRENKKCFQNVKKSSISLPDLRKIPQTQDSQCLDVRHMECGGKRHKRTNYLCFVLLKTSTVQPLSQCSIIIILIITYLLLSNHRGFIITVFITTTTTFL